MINATFHTAGISLSNSWEYLNANHGAHVLWYLSTASPDWALVSSMSQISLILCNQSLMDGSVVDFQKSGIKALAALSRCLDSDFLYLLSGKLVTWSRQQAASSDSEVSVICVTMLLTSDQYWAICGHSHQMWRRVPRAS